MYSHTRKLNLKLKCVATCVNINLDTYHCKNCDFESDLKVNLAEHFRLVHKNREANNQLNNILQSYKCENCDFKTYSLLLLTKHIRKHCSSGWWKECKSDTNHHKSQPVLAMHTKPTRVVDWFKCEQCSYKTIRKTHLKSHIGTHHKANHWDVDVDWFKCEKCPYKTMKEIYLKMHMATQHQRNYYYRDGSFKCNHCLHTAKHLSCIKKHIGKKHGNSHLELLKCKHCDYTANYIDLQSHVSRQHTVPLQWFRCEYCNYRTLNLRALFGHMSKHQLKDAVWIKCKHCSYITTNKYYLNLHVMRQHRNPAVILKCTVCSYTSSLKADLDRHMFAEHNDGGENRNIQPTVKTPNVKNTCASKLPKAYKCESCDFEADYSVLLSYHRRVLHEKAKVGYDLVNVLATFSCLHCEFQTCSLLFLTKHYFEQHPTMNRPIKMREFRNWFRCGRCDYKTNDKEWLKMHMQVSCYATNWLKCEVCNFRTKWRGDLRRHVIDQHE